jgi:WD40 repeat protein
VVDGKEAYTVETVAATHAGAVQVIDQSRIHDVGDKLVAHQFLISQSGAHIACVTVDANNLSHVFLDGAKSQDYRTVDLGQVAFVGENLVYAAQTGDDKWHMFVNNKPGPAYDSVKSLELSDDNRHYAFIGGMNGGNSVVVADGVPGTPRPGGGLGIHGLVIASNGRVAYLGYTLNRNHDPSSESLFVGDQQISPVTSPITSTFKTGAARSDVKVVFSPDGKKFAYAKPVPGGIAAVIDGKQSIAYDGIGLIQFSPDSRRAFFVGNKNVIGNFVVIDGQEMSGQNLVKNFVFSQDGSRFGYEAYDGQLGFSMVVDGKQSGRFWNLIEKSLSFSSDGKHSVYAACTQYGKCQVIEDGTTTNVSGLYTFQTRMPTRIVFPPFFFSPDNTRLAYAYPKSDGTVIVINGQEIARGTYFTYHCFSPDSKHFAVGTWTGKGYGVLVDGKVGPTYDDIVEADANANIFRFEDAHTLRFLGVKGGSVYRVTVDLGG